MSSNRPLDALRSQFEATLASWSSIATQLQNSFAVTPAQFREEKPASKFILTWMQEVRKFDERFGSLFGRKQQPALSDHFTSAVAFSLEQFLQANELPPKLVRCEDALIQKGKKRFRPDIAVAFGDSRPCVTIECKAQMGWDRLKWLPNLEQRNATLREWAPDCIPFLCVLTKRNWKSGDFFDPAKNGDSDGQLWFCMSDWNYLTEDPFSCILPPPIEQMFLEILKRLQKTPSIDREIVKHRMVTESVIAIEPHSRGDNAV
jgi:hypothetical protein